MLFLDEPIRGQVVMADRCGREVSFLVIVGEAEDEILVSDGGIDALGCKGRDPSRGAQYGMQPALASALERRGRSGRGSPNNIAGGLFWRRAAPAATLGCRPPAAMRIRIESFVPGRWRFADETLVRDTAPPQTW